ncbi:MAG: DHH family phosphoesterase [Patescibacteria group bacterium]|jgi:nanoRNase/pAp phosphatase (c-di-AMP/oligoRNAs hydrolase)
MESTPLQQTIDLVKKAQRVLVCLPRVLSTDAVAAGVALHAALSKQGKQVRVVATDITLPATHAFLPKTGDISSELNSLRKFVITVDTAKAPVAELSYDVVGDKLNIFLTPKHGAYESKDVQLAPMPPSYDCVITLDCQDYDDLGRLFEENADFFYATPVINIDHSPANQHFGQVNLVDLVATSVCEMMYDILKTLDERLITEYVATALLAGIIAKTKSFQTATVTPKALTVASALMAVGARRDEIIRNLFQTKSLAVMKLWGRALARLRVSDDGRLVWAVLNRADFERAGANPDSLPGILDELMVNTPDASIMAVVYEDPAGGVTVLVQTHRTIHAGKLFAQQQPTSMGHVVSWHVDGTIADAETKLMLALESLPKVSAS